MRVFLAWHTRVDSESEDSKLLGVYSSEEAARAAVARLRDKPGFRSYPDGFEVSEYEVDRDTWTEGFGFNEP
jgi:hypothetical protein